LHALPASIKLTSTGIFPLNLCNLSRQLGKKQSVTMISPNFQMLSLGTFTRFDGEQCRWRVENGTDDPTCTADEYGQRRHRGWVNMLCNQNMRERTRLLTVNELAACEFELIVQSPEVCPPLPAPTRCNEDRLPWGVTTQGAFVDINNKMRNWTIDFYKVRARTVWAHCNVRPNRARISGGGAGG
jgi:hypothetical protein